MANEKDWGCGEGESDEGRGRKGEEGGECLDSKGFV